MRSRPADAIRPDHVDLWLLFKLVRRRKPETILEFGSGCSTVVLGAAANQNGVGHVWSVEATQKWADANRDALPATIRECVTLVYTPAVEDDRDVPGWIHEDVPDVQPDFIYLDGPPLRPGLGRWVAFDVADLEARFRPGFVMVVDGRKKNVDWLLANLRRQYRYAALHNHRSLFELR